MISAEAMAVLEQHFEHLNWTQASDPAQFVDASFAWRDQAEGVTVSGVAGYVAALLRWRRAFPGCWWELRSLYGGDGRISCEVVLRGRHMGVLTTSQGFAAPTGREIELPMCEIYHIAGGKLMGIHAYYNLAALLGQLGRSYVQPINACRQVVIN